MSREGLGPPKWDMLLAPWAQQPPSLPAAITLTYSTLLAFLSSLSSRTKQPPPLPAASWLAITLTCSTLPTSSSSLSPHCHSHKGQNTGKNGTKWWFCPKQRGGRGGAPVGTKSQFLPKKIEGPSCSDWYQFSVCESNFSVKIYTMRLSNIFLATNFICTWSQTTLVHETQNNHVYCHICL